MKVPTVEEVVRAEGFEPTPSQTELYRPGAVLVPNARGGHDAVVEDCIGVEPAVSIMSQSSIATTLSAGVSTRLGVSTAAASAGVQKRLTFIDPEQRTISLGVLQATEDCREQLSNAARLQDLSQAIVVHDVLVAIVQNTVCTRADAKGTVVALGAAEAAAYSECVQESDAQVPLGFKSVPLAKLVSAASAPTAPAAATTPGLDFGATADLGVEARLREQNCAREAEDRGAASRAARLNAVRQDVLQQATAAWSRLSPDATACVGLPKSERGACVQAVQQWLDTAGGMPAALAASVERVQTTCGPRDAAFPAQSEVVVAKEVGEAKALLRKLQTAADPKTASVAVSGGTASSSAPAGGAADAKLDAFLAMKIEGPPRPTSQSAADKALKDSIVAKAKALAAVEAHYVEVIKQGEPRSGVEALVRMGEAYENMGNSLIHSYIPTYLTADQVEVYTMGLEDKAFVQREKAINAYKLALERAYEVGLYNADTQTAIARLHALSPRDFPPMHEPLSLLTDPSLAEVVAALQYEDFRAARQRLKQVSNRTSAQAQVAAAIIARGMRDFSTADKLYAALLKAHPGDRAVVGCASAYHVQHRQDYKRAEKALQAFVDANRGQLGPDDQVFHWMQGIDTAKAADRKRQAEDAQRAQREKERQARAKDELRRLETATASLEQLQQTHQGCPAFRDGIGEEITMVVAQARMVLEAEEADMAIDVLTFVEQIRPMAEELGSTCR